MTNYAEKVSEFELCFRESFSNTLQPDGDSVFPFVKEFDSFVLIGINTVAEYSVFRNPFASNGLIDDRQSDFIERILSNTIFQNRMKIVVGHHHFSKEHLDIKIENSVWKKVEKQTMKLREKRRILKMFRSHDVKAVLHGHLHESNRYFRKGVQCINAGGTTLGYENELKINYLQIEDGFIELNIQSVKYNKPETTILHPVPYPGQFRSKIQQEICLN